MGLDQNEAPIVQALVDHIRRGYISFHMPGHKSGSAVEAGLRDLMGNGFFKMDLTELPLLDDLHLPQGCIFRAQELAAKLYGVCNTFFLVNGASCGIQAGIMSSCSAGDKILIPRNAHRSVMAGLIMSGAEPIWLANEMEDTYGVPLPPTLASIHNAIKENCSIKAFFAVNPTYHGFGGEIEKHIKTAHSFGLTTIVDEAHGPHFHFHRGLPQSAVSSGADIVVHSTHKMLAGANQGAMLHVGLNSLLSPHEVFRQLNLVQTTSPSYPILATLDAARRQMALNGERLLDDATKLGHSAREAINKIEGVKCAPTSDPLKLLISFRELGIGGAAAAQFLRDKYQIQVELADLYNILVLVTFGNKSVELKLLVEAIKVLAKTLKADTAIARLFQLIKTCPEPVVHLLPRQAWFSARKKVALHKAVGATAAEMVVPYPPGVPLLSPGEVVTQEIIELIEELAAVNLAVQGSEDPSLKFLNVVAK